MNPNFLALLHFFLNLVLSRFGDELSSSLSILQLGKWRAILLRLIFKINFRGKAGEILHRDTKVDVWIKVHLQREPQGCHAPEAPSYLWQP